MPCRSMEIVAASLSFQAQGRRTVINLKLAGAPMPADGLGSSTGGSSTGSRPLFAGAARATGDGCGPEDTELLHAVMPLGALGALLLACGQSPASSDASLDTIVGSRVAVETDGDGTVETVGGAAVLHAREVLSSDCKPKHAAVTGTAAASPRASQANDAAQAMGDQLWTV